MHMKKIVLAGLALMLFAFTPGRQGKPAAQDLVLKPSEIISGINLTVAEGKRLIAEGVAHHPEVRKKLRSGMIIITKGTTNTYIAERLTGLDAPHGSFMTGNITPAARGRVDEGMTKVPEIILVDGKVVDMPLDEAVKKLRKDDIVFKGANLLNYERKQAAVCIGSATGGTTATIRPYTGDEKARLVVPIGLEKEVWGDLEQYEKLLGQNADRLGSIPRVWVHQKGYIFTEIEALQVFGRVKAIPFAAGGIAGREGGISLAVYGDSAEVKKVLDVVEKIQGAGPFIPWE